MGKALEGVRVLDMTHVQSGPTCTQILAWFGADVIKIERPGEGDPTRGQLRDIPGVDSLYFTMLNSNKRGVTLNPKTEAGKKIFTKLIEKCDVMVENFAPGAIDRMGFPWEKIQQINPRMIYASVKGFGPGPYEDCKVYENVAQCTGGSASTTGEIDRVSRWSQVRRSEIPAPASIWWPAFWLLCFIAKRADAANASPSRCRTPS